MIAFLTMLEEIEAAVVFVSRVLTASNDDVTDVSSFKSCLSSLLEERFQGHWHTDYPGKGQAYRSIRIHPTEPVDPVLSAAANRSHLSINFFVIPVEFTLWVDPKEVSCRFGDLKSTYCTVLKNGDNKASTINVTELLDSARALYFRQQHFTVSDNSPGQLEVPFHLMNNSDMLGYPLPPSGSPPSAGFHMYGYLEGYLPLMMYPPHVADGGVGGGGPSGVEGSSPVSQSFQASFTSTAVNTTPRKSGRGGNFRKGGSNGNGGGSGRGSKHRDHQHQQQHNGDSSAAAFNHNHNNNHNANGHHHNGSSSNGGGGGGSWGGDRFHWVRGAKNQQLPHHHHHHHHHHPPHHQHSNGGGGSAGKDSK